MSQFSLIDPDMIILPTKMIKIVNAIRSNLGIINLNKFKTQVSKGDSYLIAATETADVMMLNKGSSIYTFFCPRSYVRIGKNRAVSSLYHHMMHRDEEKCNMQNMYLKKAPRVS